jgi:nucleoside-diphosphate-sugar epimerase
MRYLVTGGAGFIGSHLVEALLMRGDIVVVLDDLSSGKLENLNSLSVKGSIIQFRIASVTNADEVSAAMRGCDGIFHLAAIPLVAQSIDDPMEVHHANTDGTIVVLDEARKQGIPVVFASSSSVYGNQNVRSLKESDAREPLSPYAATKLAGEEYCRVFARVYDLPVAVLRFFNVYGPRQGADSDYSGVISSFCDAIVNGRKPIVYGSGDQSRDFIFVQDVARGLMMAMKHTTFMCPMVNLGSGKSYSVLDVLRRLTDVDPEFQPARSGDVYHTQADMFAAHCLLGFQTQTSFEDGLTTTLQWYKNNKHD